MRERDALSEFDDAGSSDPYSSSGFGDEPKDVQEDTVPKSRLDEVLAQRDRADLQRDEAIRGLLNVRQNIVVQPQAPQAAPTPRRRVQLPEDVDKETADLMKPVLDPYFDQYSQQVAQEAAAIATQEALNAINNQYGAGLQQANKEAGLNLIDGRVPGFKSELKDDVAALFNSLPPEERQKYDNEMGIEALAWRVRAEKKNAAGPVDFSDMAYSERSGGKGSVPQKSEEDAWNLSEEEFEARFGV